jgi:hypothetical protein
VEWWRMEIIGLLIADHADVNAKDKGFFDIRNG